MGRPITQEDIDMISNMKFDKKSLLISIFMICCFFSFLIIFSSNNIHHDN